MWNESLGPFVRVTRGFHGTSRANALKILDEGFEPSRNPYDWLGHGPYFFDSAPMRVLDWVRNVHGEDGVVLAAEISLDACLDLLDVAEMQLLERFARILGIEEMPLKQNNGMNAKDCVLINSVCEALENGGRAVHSVRAAFREGGPVYAGSAIYNLSHVQIVVRDQSCIRKLQMLS